MGGGYGVSIDTDESIVGVIPRVIRSLFDGITERELEYSFIVKVSYIEVSGNLSSLSKIDQKSMEFLAR